MDFHLLPFGIEMMKKKMNEESSKSINMMRNYVETTCKHEELKMFFNNYGKLVYNTNHVYIKLKKITGAIL